MKSDDEKMVVHSYIELDKYEEDDLILKFKMHNWRDVKDFYKQKFTPDLITKYFDKWEEVSVKNDINIVFRSLNQKNGYDDEICLWYDENHDIIRMNLNHTTYLPWVPKTLDRFICYCQDAKIELFWR